MSVVSAAMSAARERPGEQLEQDGEPRPLVAAERQQGAGERGVGVGRRGSRAVDRPALRDRPALPARRDDPPVGPRTGGHVEHDRLVGAGPGRRSSGGSCPSSFSAPPNGVTEAPVVETPAAGRPGRRGPAGSSSTRRRAVVRAAVHRDHRGGVPRRELAGLVDRARHGHLPEPARGVGGRPFGAVFADPPHLRLRHDPATAHRLDVEGEAQDTACEPVPRRSASTREAAISSASSGATS